MAQVLIAIGFTYWSMIAFGATSGQVFTDRPKMRGPSDSNA